MNRTKPTPQATPEIIARIQALLRLSSSPNEHEASLALQRASDLLLKHNLSRAEVEGREVSQSGVGETRIEIAGRVTDWHRVLMVSIADHCFCKSIRDRRWRDGFIVVGNAENRETARVLFAWILEQLRHISLVAMLDNAGRGKRAVRWRFNFCLGVCLRIACRLEDHRKVQEKAAAQVPGLILVRSAEVERYVERNIPTTPAKPICSRKPRRSGALICGVIAGNRISLKPRAVLEDTAP